MNDKELKQNFRIDISKHLEENNGNIKIEWNGIDDIIIKNIDFDTKNINFMDKKCNYNLIYKEQIEIENINRITFNNCTFRYEPVITSENIWLIEFKDCIFSGMDDIKTNILDDSNINKKVYFKNCDFEKFKFGDMQYNSNIKLSYFELKECDIKKFTIKNIEIASKFYINKQHDGNNTCCSIGKLTIDNVIFKENFKLHNCEVEEIIIKDTDFEKKADFYLSYFKSGLKKDNDKNQTEIYFSALNFKSLAFFGDTKFDEKFHLNYVTIEGLSHFRKAQFNKGLNLDYVNIQNEMNFFDSKYLDSEESKQNTSQETYRIIKNNFEKLGNKIEANKYHALELDQKRRELEKDKIKNWKEYIVFKLHDLSSEHSTNWVLALLWIITIGFISTSLISPSLVIFPYILFILLSHLIFSKNKYAFLSSVITFGIIIFVFADLNFQDLTSNISLISITHSELIFIGVEKEKLTPWQNIVMFFNKISLGYLYYQFLISVRKDTRK